jgi:hypothetical protein
VGTIEHLPCWLREYDKVEIGSPRILVFIKSFSLKNVNPIFQKSPKGVAKQKSSNARRANFEE